MFFTHIDPITEINMEERQARCDRIDLLNTPPLLDKCFQLLQASGAIHFALFGGAIRDADYGVRYDKPYQIKDYDLRVWLPEDNHEQEVQRFVNNLEQNSGLTVEKIPSPGTGRIRYCLNYDEIEFDISVRPIPESYRNMSIPVEAVAIDRACDSDAGICSVAIDPQKQAWAMPEYMFDQTRKTLTIYPNPDAARKHAYAKRMKKKFPDHNMLELQTSKRVGEIGVSADLKHATLYTNRLELRSANQYEKSYLTEKYNSLLKDPESTKLFRTGCIWTDAEIETLIADQIKCWEEGTRFSAFLVHDRKNTNVFIGVLFIDYHYDHFPQLPTRHLNTAEMGYMIHPSAAGFGFATEMGIAGKKYIKHIMHLLPFKLDEIVATVEPDNGASKAILKKILKQYERQDADILANVQPQHTDIDPKGSRGQAAERRESDDTNNYYIFKAYGDKRRNFFFKLLKQEQHQVMSSEEDGALDNIKFIPTSTV